MKVLLLSRYGAQGASSRVRFYQYLPHLHSRSIDVDVAPLLPDMYLNELYAGRRWGITLILLAYFRRFARLFTSGKYNLIWIEYELFPWMPAWFESFLSLLRIPYVVDYDDAIFHRYDGHRAWWVRLLLGNKIESVMRGACLVTVGNGYLAEHALNSGAHWVEQLPTSVDIVRYKASSATQGEQMTIGWIGSPATSIYLESVRPALAAICRDGRAKVVLIGASDPGWRDVPYQVITWTEATEVCALQAIDVGIMPLPDNPWERGKCGYKLIQYMACGKPVVASPVGVNCQIVSHGIDGFLAESSMEWLAALSELLANIELRRSFGAAGRKKVEQFYSVQAMAPRMAAWLRFAAGDRTCAG